jgi:arylsulfatase A-like enzyme
MDRRETLKAFTALAGVAFAGQASALAVTQTPGRRPNIVLIVVDDLRWDEYGAGGHPYLKTPNIDRLAREGLSFSNVFHATPLCSPNRASILTGEYASKHGIYGNVDRTRLSFSLRTMTRHLHAAGYQTGHVGKWHMGDDPSPRPGYDFWAAFPGQGRIIDPELWDGDGLKVFPGYVTDILTDRAIAFMEQRDETRPFFLYFGHKAVHPDVIQRKDGSIDLERGMKYISADRHTDRYAAEIFPRAPSAQGPLAGRPRSKMIAHLLALREAPDIQSELGEIMDPGTSEQTIRERAEMLLSVDESVGRVLAHLEATNTLDETVVIFTSDNGFFFGEHGLSIERRLPYEESIRMPLLVRYPSLARPGGVASELASSTDVAPTVLDLAGLPIPAHIQGRSMKAALDGRTTAHGRSGVLTEYYAHDLPMAWTLDADYKSIRTERYKYIRWIQHEDFDELYDLAADPFEMTNIIDREDARGIAEDLRSQLRRLVAESVSL